MKNILFSDTAIGYGVVLGTVILAVLIYTLLRLRRQVKKTKWEEKQKKSPRTKKN